MPSGAAYSNLDFVRRTVWGGTQELAEIQMPDGAVNGQVDQTERDTGFVAIPPFTLTQGTQYLDPNPYRPGALHARAGARLNRPGFPGDSVRWILRPLIGRPGLRRRRNAVLRTPRAEDSRGVRAGAAC
jgi:hypothetical protein